MDSLHQKQQQIIDSFSDCQKPEDIYNRVIEIGQKGKKKEIANLDKKDLVPGCQSLLYLCVSYRGGKLFFEAHSDALISRGLAELLVWYYSGETPEAILKSPPSFLEKLGISNSLTPSRVSGLYNIHLKMKQKALETIVLTKST